MAKEAKNKVCTLCDKMGLKPFTKENVFYHYIPITGLFSYGGLSVNMMNPALISKISPKKDMTNVLLISTIIGSAFYLYGRPHLRKIPNAKRGMYSVLGAALFSMGSVLGWAIISSEIRNNNAAIGTILGLATGAAVVKLSTDYINDSDKLVTGKN